MLGWIQLINKIKLLLLTLLILIEFPVIPASCSENQIDINSASLEELDELYGIGPVKSQSIIDTRPFDCVDDLIDVYGIGETTLDKIKQQGLACVEDEEEKEEDEKESDNELDIDEEKESSEQASEIKSSNKREINTLELETIVLNSKDIKRENNNENLDINNYSIYGFITFCILLVFLFIIKENRRKKNEFR